MLADLSSNTASSGDKIVERGELIGEDAVERIDRAEAIERCLGERLALRLVGHVGQRLGGDVGVPGRGGELLVAEQDLDDADIDVLFEQVRGEGMA